MDKKQFTGKTLEDALAEAAKAFATHKDLLCYNVIQQPASGLLSRLFSRSVRIEAWVETVEQDLQAAAREVVRQTLGKNSSTKNILSSLAQQQKETISSQPDKSNSVPQKKASYVTSNQEYQPRTFLHMESEGVQELFETYNQLFFAAFGVSQDQIESIVQENEAVVKVSDAEIETFLSRSDKLSLAYEHVFKRIAQKKLGDISARISIQAGDSSEKREERLIGMAKSLAEKVKKTGKSVILSSKSSQERRVIHLALDGFVGVATRSVGTGDKRRLVIYSTEKKNRSNQQTYQTPKGTEKNQAQPANKYKKRFPKKRNHSQAVHNKSNTDRVGAVSSLRENNSDELDIQSATEQKQV